MTVDREKKYQEMATRGKYRNLYAHLLGRSGQEWRATFAEIESILGIELPASARLHRPWWSNQKGGNGHSQSLAWTVAGWETAEVDIDAETLLLRRKNVPGPDRKLSLDEWWPPHSVGVWPKGLSLRREDMYD